MHILGLILLVALVGTHTWAADKVWTIDDHIAAIEEMLTVAKDVRDVTLASSRYTDHERELAAATFAKDIADLESWLSLALAAKQGDNEAAMEMYKMEQQRFRILFVSAEYLGLDRAAYRDYVDQREARVTMFHHLLQRPPFGVGED